MLKQLRLLLLFFCFFSVLKIAAVPIVPNEFVSILKISDPNVRERKMVKYIKAFYKSRPMDIINSARPEMDALFIKYDIKNRTALNYFIESLYQKRAPNIIKEETLLVNAINESHKDVDHYLLFSFWSDLGFLQTRKGSTTEAIKSFRQAKMETILLNDGYLQIMVDINISDIYYRNNFYSQSLFYLDQAQSILDENKVSEQRLKDIIYFNKAENYFRMNNLPLLKKYSAILNGLRDTDYKKHIFSNRTNYYLSILNHDYKGAIKLMAALQKDTLFKFETTDKQNLADAYYQAGMSDSAKNIINRLLADKEQDNHPEIKFHLYEVLGEIAWQKNDKLQAANNFKMALQQSEDQINRLTQVDNISSQIKVDEIQGSYIQKEEDYKRERLWLILLVIIAVLAVVTVAMFYRNAKQRRYYEQLLFTAKKEELAHINSHEVRRHLSNIIGLINVIKTSKNKDKEYFQAEEYLLYAAEHLDDAIKNISEKLE